MSVKGTEVEKGLTKNEQEILDTALLESDQLLARSLHDDEARSRRRRVWLSAIVLGGVVVSISTLVLMSGMLAVSTPVVSEPGEIKRPSDKQWEERLLSIKESDRWSVGAYAGMDLVKIPGDRPYKILKKHWPKIATNGRKQILKGFTPGMMGNKKIHERFFDVMHLGMTDPDPEVRKFAATYIKKQGLPDFFADPEGYAEWRKQTQGRPAVVIAQKENTEESKPRNTETSYFQLAWQKFSSRDYKASEQLFRKVLEQEPKNSDAMNGLGWSLLNQQKRKEAKFLLEAALKLEKNHWGAMTGLAVCLKEEGEVDEAVVLWERIVENVEGPCDARVHLATVYFDRKEYQTSIPHYEKLVEWYPEEKVFQENLKKAREALGTDKK